MKPLTQKKMEQLAKEAKGRVTAAQRRRELLLPSNAKFDRCPGKDLGKVADFEKHGNFNHSGKSSDHICDICRCCNTAGYQTTHLGSGYCKACERTTSRRAARLVNERHEQVIRRLSCNQPAEVIMKSLELDIAEQREIEAVSLAAKRGKTVCDAFIDVIVAGKHPDSELIEKLDKILEVLEPDDSGDCYEQPGIEEAINYIEDLKAYLELPTEYVNGQLRVMSDKTRMGMANNLLKTMSSVGLGELHKQGMIPRNDVYIFLDACGKVTKRIAEEEWGDRSKQFMTKWINQMKTHILELRGAHE